MEGTIGHILPFRLYLRVSSRSASNASTIRFSKTMEDFDSDREVAEDGYEADYDASDSESDESDESNTSYEEYYRELVTAHSQWT